MDESDGDGLKSSETSPEVSDDSVESVPLLLLLLVLLSTGGWKTFTEYLQISNVDVRVMGQLMLDKWQT